MLKKIDETATLFEPAKAEALAAELQAGDPDWTYRAKHDPKGTGYSLIEIFDEAGELVGRI